MTTHETKQGKTIGNIGALDLRSATEETVDAISAAGNIGVVIYSRETASLFARLRHKNVGASIEVSADARLTNGQVAITRDHFRGQKDPIDMIVNGQMFFEPDVQAEDVEKGLGQLFVNGQLLYPEHIAPALMPKLMHVNGRAQSYIQADYVTASRLEADEAFLQSLEDGSSLAVIATLSIPDVLSNELWEHKISRLQVIGRIICHQENLQAIASRLVSRGGQIRITTIPAGHQLIEQPVVLDSAVLSALPSPRLYCAARVQIGPDVDADTLDSRLESLVTEDIVICPAALKDVIYRKCNPLSTRIILYEGELWLVDDEMEIVPSRFDFLEGKATLVVSGELTISPDVEPGVLAERLAKVHNFGEIYSTPEQRGAIQARLGINEGELLDSSREESEEQGANVGYLRL